MVTIVSIFAIILAVILVLLFTKNIKMFFVIAAAVVLISSLSICVMKPVMHKQFSFNVIDYLIRFNTDGSVTTTKQTTIKTIKEDKK